MNQKAPPNIFERTGPGQSKQVVNVVIIGKLIIKAGATLAFQS
jgi:hypothetical protein